MKDMSVGSVNLTASDLVANAEKVATAAAAAAYVTETRGRLDTDLAKAIIDAGFARYFVPSSVGGIEGSFAELGRAVVAIGRGCTSTAWCASIIAYLGRMAAYLPREAWAEVWANGPNAVIVGSVTPSGNAEPVPGGWRVSGRWPSISAVDFADWVLVTPKVDNDRSKARVFAVPRAECEVLDDWNPVGMKGTGSNTVLVDNVFVPEHRGFARGDLLNGQATDSTARPHRVPLPAVLGLSFAMPVLGAARGALDAWRDGVIARLRHATPGAPGLSRTTYALTLARGAGEIDAAELLLDRVAALADSGDLAALPTARNLRDCSLAVEILTTVVNDLLRTSGTSGLSATNPIQRFWRDVNSAASHVGLQFESAATAYSAPLLDVEQ
jgi:alkylation response protein AidB-like acyl-CoA dehydrogenase